MIGPLTSAFRDVQANLFRSFVSVLGVVIAITAVLVIDATTTATADAAKGYLADQFGAPATLNIPVEDDASAEKISAALNSNGVRHIVLLQSEQLVVVRGDSRSRVEGRFARGDLADVEPVNLIAGELPAAMETGTLPVALSPQTLAELNIPLGQAVGTQVEVGELGDSATFDFGRSPLRPAVISAVQRADRDGVARALLMGRASPGHSTSSVRLRVSPLDERLVEDTVRSVADSSTVERLDKAGQVLPLLRQQARIGQLLELLALVIGGLGLLTTRLAVTRERTVEVGIRRALGATRTAVFATALFETMLVTAVAAAAAVGLASFLFAVLPSGSLSVTQSASVTRLTLPTVSLIRGVAAAGVVGLLASLLPAAVASRTSISEAVRR